MAKGPWQGQENQGDSEAERHEESLDVQGEEWVGKWPCRCYEFQAWPWI